MLRPAAARRRCHHREVCDCSGADGVFLEFHTDPDKALCDGPSCLPISEARGLLTKLNAIHEIVNG
ncbi:MAG: hypothetical protein RLN72_05500 [Henriciella sp.]